MYTKENIEGIIFSCTPFADQIYKIGSIDGEYCFLSKIDGSWKEPRYFINDLIKGLNGVQWKVLEYPNTIHECW